MFVDIAIDIGNVIISCGAVIVTCDYGFFLFDFFLRQKQKKNRRKKKARSQVTVIEKQDVIFHLHSRKILLLALCEL